MAILGRSKKVIRYHGREGHPVVHTDKGGRKFIMVRHPSGRGGKRLYNGSRYQENGKVKRLRL